MPADVLTLRSPSKINLHLRVAAPDASGYHPLRSWMVTTTLCDELTFTIARQRRLTCDDPTLACDATNLVWRAADALREIFGSANDASIHLAKRIPAGAGLGGGSGNAAATLVGMNRLLGLNRSDEALRTVAGTLGSDVPFFLGAASAIATGRGERLEATPAPRVGRFAVLLLPPFAVSTAAAYQALDVLRPSAAVDTLDSFAAGEWSESPADELLAHLVNDLEPAAFALEPRLAGLRDAAERTLCRIVRMSGSGSTLFTLFDDADEAASAARATANSLAIRSIFVQLGKPSGFFD